MWPRVPKTGSKETRKEVLVHDGKGEKKDCSLIFNSTERGKGGGKKGSREQRRNQNTRRRMKKKMEGKRQTPCVEGKNKIHFKVPNVQKRKGERKKEGNRGKKPGSCRAFGGGKRGGKARLKEELSQTLRKKKRGGKRKKDALTGIFLDQNEEKKETLGRTTEKSKKEERGVGLKKGRLCGRPIGDRTEKGRDDY